MTTILFAFIVAFALALVLTPLVGKLGVRLGAVDAPAERKVHTRTIPRSGGLAIAAAFVLALAAAKLLSTSISNLLIWEERQIFAVLGAAVVFAVGLCDDVHRLGPRIKFLAQILAATLAFYGGVRIEAFVAGGVAVDFGLLSWVITVFWFLLFINAMNLIDGLDGLAAGVAFFTSAVMVVLALMQGNLLTALKFAALGGALLGFLRYNFNPASVFMGDGGSYFIGYAIAAISILGSIKSQVGATLLIPLLALGVPIFDTILSPLRRWVIGRQMFQPDKEHIHHRLLKLGLSSRKVVLILYGVSFALCVVAILLINFRDEMAGLLLIVLGAGAVLVVRKLGYLEYFAADKLFGWLKDVSDVTGFSRDRRSFLNLQMEIERAESPDDLWIKLCLALELMRFDRAELHLNGHPLPPSPAGATLPGTLPAAPASPAAGDAAGVAAAARNTGGRPLSAPAAAPGTPAPVSADPARPDRRRGRAAGSGGRGVWTREEQNGQERVRVWARGHHRRQEDALGEGQLRIEFPLRGGNPGAMRLVLLKNLSREPIQPFTLRRVEYLRRSLVNALTRLEKEEQMKKEMAT
jgi:UDP-GlcNAc:undecaprenyl-phosphate GlcNAc-1-phosphate transferase